MWYGVGMRTTLDLDEDVLGVAKQLAVQKRVSTGKVVSDLMRQALAPKKAPRMRNGFRLLDRPPGSKPVTMEMINQFRDEE
jgi:hypothetical protein